MGAGVGGEVFLTHFGDVVLRLVLALLPFSVWVWCWFGLVVSLRTC
jgi:hypothetical protein